MTLTRFNGSPAFVVLSNKEQAARAGWSSILVICAKSEHISTPMGELLTLRVNCSPLRSKSAHFSGHLPITPPAPDQTIIQILPAYYAYLSSGQYSKYTPDDFTSDIKKFGLFVGGKLLKDIQTVDIQQWVGVLKKTMTAKTVSRKITAIGNYFLWLERENVLERNPAEAIRAPRVTSPLPDILFESECRRLLDSASSDPRTYLLLLLLLEAGLKKAELMGLQVTHFDLSNKYRPELWVKHTGKQVRKDRKLRLPSDITPAFEDYLAHYTITDTLFPYTGRFIEQLLSDSGKRAKLQKKVTASTLRDTFVVRSLKQGMPLADVLRKVGLSEQTWEDAKGKYERLVSQAI